MKNFIIAKNNRDLLEDAFEDFFKPVCFNKASSNMKTDIKENEKSYEFDIEMPGFNKNEIDISLQDGYLSITAEKKENEEKNDKQTHNYIRRERSMSVSRSYYVADVDKDKIKAKYENGILNIYVPKEEPKKLETNTIAIE